MRVPICAWRQRSLREGGILQSMTRPRGFVSLNLAQLTFKYLRNHQNEQEYNRGSKQEPRRLIRKGVNHGPTSIDSKHSRVAQQPLAHLSSPGPADLFSAPTRQ